MRVECAGGQALVLIDDEGPGLSGAELANLLNEAALLAARRGKKKVEMADVDDAREKVRSLQRAYVDLWAGRLREVFRRSAGTTAAVNESVLTDHLMARLAGMTPGPRGLKSHQCRTCSGWSISGSRPVTSSS